MGGQSPATAARRAAAGESRRGAGRPRPGNRGRDPPETSLLADTLADTLPDRVKPTMDGAEVVDTQVDSLAVMAVDTQLDIQVVVEVLETEAGMVGMEAGKGFLVGDQDAEEQQTATAGAAGAGPGTGSEVETAEGGTGRDDGREIPGENRQQSGDLMGRGRTKEKKGEKTEETKEENKTGIREELEKGMTGENGRKEKKRKKNREGKNRKREKRKKKEKQRRRDYRNRGAKKRKG